MLIKHALACLLLSLTTACGTVSDGKVPSVAPAAKADTSAVLRGEAFAQAHCAACHAIGSGLSPLAQAPSFAATANMPGLTADTLKPWLHDSHNYPEIMNFALTPAQTHDLTLYMLTLRQADYRPPIQ